MANAVYQSTETHVNHETGEVTRTVSNNVRRISPEPEYVKMYIADLGNLMGLSAGEKRLLLELVGRMGFTGEISLNATSRKRIAERCGMTSGAFRNALSSLCQKEFLIRVATNEFEANPIYFAKGQWATIEQRRKDFELRVRYGKDGKRTVYTSEADDTVSS